MPVEAAHVALYPQVEGVLLAGTYVRVGVPGTEGVEAARLERITFDPTSADVPPELVAVANALK